MHKYIAQRRYGYVGIDEYEDGKCLRTVITGITPQKLGKQFADLMNMAYEKGYADGREDYE